jgi:mevalonate kinase
MPAFTAAAPGKIILFGEHAVVYGRPAIAVPVIGLRARAVVSAEPRAASGQVRIEAPDIGLKANLDRLPITQPLAATLRAVLAALGLSRSPACLARVTSTIPVASGLGSGAAITIALIRAYSAFLGHPLPDDRVSAIAFEIEKLHHGTPSGIDNTVITFARPVYFQRKPAGPIMETFHVAQPFLILIGDTGVRSPTAVSVGEVRKAWQAEPERYERLFDEIGSVAQAARSLIEAGRLAEMGALMDENQACLRQVGVSSPELEGLIAAAKSAGALGAKLSGGGRGGNMIALVEEGAADAVTQALVNAGAARTHLNQVKNSRPGG